MIELILFRMPIILSEKITHLNPKFFYLGGGDPDFKISN